MPRLKMILVALIKPKFSIEDCRTLGFLDFFDISYYQKKNKKADFFTKFGDCNIFLLKVTNLNVHENFREKDRRNFHR